MNIIKLREHSVNQNAVAVAFAEAVLRQSQRPLPPLDDRTKRILDDLHRIVPHLVYRRGFSSTVRWAIASYGVDGFARSAGAHCRVMVDLWAIKCPNAKPWHERVSWIEILLPSHAHEWGLRGEWPMLEVTR